METIQETLAKADARAKGRAVATMPDDGKLSPKDIERRRIMQEADEQFAALQTGTAKRTKHFGIPMTDAVQRKYGCMIETLRSYGSESGFSEEQANAAIAWRMVVEQNQARLGVGRIKSGSDLDVTHGYDSAEESDAELAMATALKRRHTELSQAGFASGGNDGMSALCTIIYLDPMGRVAPAMIGRARMALNGMVAVQNRGRGLAK